MNITETKNNSINEHETNNSINEHETKNNSINEKKSKKKPRKNTKKKKDKKKEQNLNTGDKKNLNTDEKKNVKVKKDYRKIGLELINKYIKNINKSNIIENSIYNYTIFKSKKRNYDLTFSNDLFRLVYKNKLQSIYLNINKNSYIKNNYLIEMINKDKINLNEIAFLEPYELFPDKWDKIIKQKKAKEKLEYSQSMGTITNIYTCSRCKQNKCSYYRLQTRRCDEPMTIFIKCLNCSKSWKTSA